MPVLARLLHPTSAPQNVTTLLSSTIVRKVVLLISNYEIVGGGLSPDLSNGLTTIGG